MTRRSTLAVVCCIVVCLWSAQATARSSCPLLTSDLHLVRTTLSDSAEPFQSEVVEAVRERMASAVSIAACEPFADSLLIKYHRAYRDPNRQKPATRSECDPEYVLVIGYKNRSKAKHKDNSVMNFTLPISTNIGGLRITTGVREVSYVKHNPGWEYFYTTTISGTVYELATGKRVFVGSVSKTETVKTKDDQRQSTSDFETTYLSNIRALARDLAGKCLDKREWRDYQKLVGIVD